MSDNKGFDPQYDDKKKIDTLYFGKENKNPDGIGYRRAEIIIDQDDNYTTAKNKNVDSTPIQFDTKDSVELFSSKSGQQKIYCWLLESAYGKHISALHIARRTEKGVYGSQEITLTPHGIYALKTFLNKLHTIDSSTKTPFKIPLSSIEEESSKRKIITEIEFVELIKDNIKSTDDFYRLLSLQKMELSVERLEGIIAGKYKNEVEIQKFLKSNIWMFGNDYVFVVEDEKINAANILDIIPQNFESYVDIIEVKLPKEKLFNFDESHKNYYSSSALTKAIAQTQNYIYELENKATDEKYQHDNNCKIIKPKGIVLFGSASALNGAESKYLRILNSSYHNLQIITYQQLLEKAQNTVDFFKAIRE